MSQVYHGDCLEVMAELESNSVDHIITDPPYGLSTEPDIVEVLTHWLAGDDYDHRGGGFMGKSWDSFVPGPSVWRECLRVLKPGGLALVFGGTRTYDLTTVALRMAGFRIVDTIMWLYGSGFPKALDISKALDKKSGTLGGKAAYSGLNGKEDVRTITAPATDLAKQWHGWKSPHLKPAWEPIILAEAPREGSYADNATKWGVAGLWIEAGRIGYNSDKDETHCKSASFNKDGSIVKNTELDGMNPGWRRPWMQRLQERNGTRNKGESFSPNGRYPANVILDEDAAAALDEMSGESVSKDGGKSGPTFAAGVLGQKRFDRRNGHNDSGGASRFFYCAKASKRERGEYNTHPTVKPLSLLTYLAKLTRTPTGGVILDPFAGSMTTALAAIKTGRGYIMIEQDADYVAIGQRRIADLLAQGVQMELMQ